MQVNSRKAVGFSVGSELCTDNVFPPFSLPQLSAFMQNLSFPVGGFSATTSLSWI